MNLLIQTNLAALLAPPQRIAGAQGARGRLRGAPWFSGGCSAANVVLMNDVDMVIEIAKERSREQLPATCDAT